MTTSSNKSEGVRLLGRREARLVKAALEVARSRGRGRVLRPFGLVERGAPEGGFTQLHPIGGASAIETLEAELPAASTEARSALVFEATLDGRDVYVIDIFAGGEKTERRHVAPCAAPRTKTAKKRG